MVVKRKGEQFLNPEDVEDGDVLVITAKPVEIETQWKDRAGNPKVRDRIAVRLPGGEEKPVTINATSTNYLLDAFGPNEDDWLGKKVVVEKRLQKVMGEDRHVLYFRAAEEGAEQSKDRLADAIAQLPAEYRGQLMAALGQK